MLYDNDEESRIVPIDDDEGIPWPYDNDDDNGLPEIDW
jgi:hypothetical protein